MSKKETVVIDKETPITSDKDVAKSVQASSWSLGKIFWGLTFVLIGTLLLLDNLNIVEIRLWNLWQLWPLFIIMAGLSILSFRGKIWTSLGVMLIIGSLGLTAWVVTNGGTFSNESVNTMANIEYQSDDTKQLELTIRAGASSLNIASRDMEFATTAQLDSNITKLSKQITYVGSAQKVIFETEGTQDWWRGGPQNKLQIDISRRLPVKLWVEAGASSIQADLSQVMLRSLDIDAGASSLSIKLGDIVSDTNISIDSGMSSVTLSIPRESGVRFVLKGGLNSKTLEGLEQVGEDTYESDDFEKASKKVVINGDLGLASVTLERY